MENAKIVKIRPISWKIVVQGKDEAEYVRNVLAMAKIQTTQSEKEPSLLEPPLYAFVATPAAETPITAVELESLLGKDKRIEIEFQE
jgi:hypothetical protein